jgi:hypothetical protein
VFGIKYAQVRKSRRRVIHAVQDVMMMMIGSFAIVVHQNHQTVHGRIVQMMVLVVAVLGHAASTASPVSH